LNRIGAADVAMILLLFDVITPIEPERCEMKQNDNVI
jgi:hypothetical protein